MLGPNEVMVVVLVIALLFGAKRLPELGRSLGEGIKEFKKSAKSAMEDEEEKPEKSEVKSPKTD